MRFSQLDQWLEWQSSLHPSTIELGLDRVLSVYQALGYSNSLPPTITVAGTNGKGSTLAMLEAMLLADGFRVGKYTSPHLYRYNERICLNGGAIDDAHLCEAFDRIDRARGEISLTYFEFGTLAALDVFHHADLDIILLETGLGGRLDAVNIVDADCSIITSIDLDHMDWLGETREAIGQEKLGISRNGRPCIIAETNPPDGLLETAADKGVQLYHIGSQFGYQAGSAETGSWLWWGMNQKVELPLPALRGQHQLQNASAAIVSLMLLRERVPVSMAAIRTGLANVSLFGRFEVQQQNGVMEIRDVAHNPAATRALAANLKSLTTPGVRRAVLAAMADKDLAHLVQPLLPLISEWYIAPLDVARAASVEQINRVLVNMGVSNDNIIAADSIAQARQMALQASQPYDQMIIFGSFYTLEAVVSPVEIVN